GDRRACRRIGPLVSCSLVGAEVEADVAVAAQIVGGRHPGFAEGLDLGDADPAVAAAQHRGPVPASQLPGLAADGGIGGRGESEQLRPLPVEFHPGAGAGAGSAGTVDDGLGGGGEVEVGVGDGDFVRMGGLSGLRCCLRGARGEFVEGGYELFGSAVGVVVEGGGDVGVVEWEFEAAQNGAGVHALIDPEYAHSAAVETVDEGALDGCGTAVGRQQGEVEVEPAEAGGGQGGGSGDGAVGHDGHGVDLLLPESGDDLSAQSLGFDHVEAQFQGAGLDR